MGTLQVGQWGGIALGPLIGGALADAFGFHMPFIVTAGLLLLSGVLVLFGVEEHFDKENGVSAIARSSFMNEWRHVLSMAGVIPTFCLRFMTSLCRSMLTPILPFLVLLLMSSEAGVSSFTGLVVGIESGAATISAIYLGRLGDRIGHRKVVLGSSLGALLCYLPLTMVAQTWQLLMLHALVGIAMGGLVASPSALLAQYTEPGEEGAVYGLDNSIVSGARAVAPLTGAAIAMALGYRGVYGANVLLMFGLFMLALRWLPDRAPEGQLNTV